jgi:hypothetical protein
MNVKIIGTSIVRILVISAGISGVHPGVHPRLRSPRRGGTWAFRAADDGIEGFHLSVGGILPVPHREVIVIHKRGICDEELRSCSHIAQRAHVSSRCSRRAPALGHVVV